MLKDDIDLRRLRYFVAVARAAGFRPAAQTLGMAQPPLSQQIMALEKQLGERLFIRHARTVELTDAGRALLADAEPLLARAARIPERLRRAASGQTGTLCLGVTPALAHHPYLPQMLREFRVEVPEVDLQFREQNTDLLCQEVIDGRLHASIIRAPVAMLDRLRVDQIGEEALLVAVPISHRFASRTSLSFHDLAGEAFVMFDRDLAAGLYDLIMAACVEAGFSMRIVHHAPQKVSALMLVASEVGITVVPASLSKVHSGSVCMIPIVGSQPRATIALATLTDDASVLPERFRQFCVDRGVALMTMTQEDRS